MFFLQLKIYPLLILDAETYPESHASGKEKCMNEKGMNNKREVKRTYRFRAIMKTNSKTRV